MNWSDLWSFSGRTRRIPYFLIGTIGFLLKSNVDRIVAMYGFHREWSFLNYWFPLPALRRPLSWSFSDQAFVATLLAVGLPFIWLGLAQTVRRLRDAGQGPWWACFFFLPFLNLLFFAVLCALPSQQTSGDELQLRSLKTLGSERLSAALLSVGITTVLGIAAVAFGTLYRANYGFGLFVAVPFCLGLFSTLVFSYRKPRTRAECIGVSLLPVTFLGIAIVLLAFEGVICVLMAAPIALALAAFGGIVGYLTQAARWGQQANPAMMGIVLIAMPVWLHAESSLRREPPVLTVRSAIDIDAPPEVVWRKVVAFSEIPAEREWLFHTGVAYPIRATISGAGPGAVRRCEFSTGAFVEPIQVWDEPRLLRFSVSENPAPLEELTPYHHIEPPHLRGYFVSHQGQFLLTALPGNRTRLEGTTWYTDKIWPTSYWQLWSDFIIHRIHMRVLRHIRREAEAAGNKLAMAK